MDVAGFRLIGDDADPVGTNVIAEAVAASVPVIEELWPFRRPRRARVVVWTDWMDGYRRGLSWWRRAIVMALGKRRIERLGQRMWPIVGGITLRTQPPAVLIKPPRLLEEADLRLGEKLFVRLDDTEMRVRSITCHELMHAYASSRALPPWLNEGIAMLTVDRFFGFDTVKPQTLELLGTVERPIRSYLSLPKLTDSELVKLYARGYWITRYLAEVHPTVLRKLVGFRVGIGIPEQAIASAIGVPRRRLWEDIDGVVFDHYHP